MADAVTGILGKDTSSNGSLKLSRNSLVSHASGRKRGKRDKKSKGKSGKQPRKKRTKKPDSSQLDSRPTNAHADAEVASSSKVGLQLPPVSNATSQLLHSWDITKQGPETDLRYIDVNLTEAARQAQLFDVHPVIKACERIRIQHLTSGGIVIERPGMKMNEMCQRWFDGVYGDFTDRLVRTWSRFGFAVATIKPHAKFIGIPLILDMVAIRVQMSVDFCGVRRYRIYRKDTQSGFSPTGEEQNITDSCLVFEKDPPDRDGICKGELACLYRDLDYFHILQNIHLQASKAAAAPLVFIQQREAKSGDDMADSCAPRGIHFPMAAEIGQDKDAVGVIALAPHQARFKEWAVRVCDSLNNNSLNIPGSQPMLDIGDEGRKAWKLEDNQQVANGPNISNLTDISQATIYMEERISTVMGVPRQIYAVSGYSHNTDTAQVNSSFQFHQDSLKRDVIRVLYDVYQEIYADINLSEASKAMSMNGWSDNMQMLFHQSSVTINLPGIPDATQMQSYYAQGALTWDQYIKYISNTTFIPLSGFNKTPPLTIRETNGMDEPETDTPSSSSAKKKKKASK